MREHLLERQGDPTLDKTPAPFLSHSSSSGLMRKSQAESTSTFRAGIIPPDSSALVEDNRERKTDGLRRGVGRERASNNLHARYACTACSRRLFVFSAFALVSRADCWSSMLAHVASCTIHERNEV